MNPMPMPMTYQEILLSELLETLNAIPSCDYNDGFILQARGDTSFAVRRRCRIAGDRSPHGCNSCPAAHRTESPSPNLERGPGRTPAAAPQERPGGPGDTPPGQSHP